MLRTILYRNEYEYRKSNVSYDENSTVQENPTNESTKSTPHRPFCRYKTLRLEMSGSEKEMRLDKVSNHRIQKELDFWRERELDIGNRITETR